MQRRSFLSAPLAAWQIAAVAQDQRVYAYGDGIPHTPEEYSRLLAQLAQGGKISEDDYSRGGVVEGLESRMASLLGKEMAVWLPTGTLANHLAVRVLAGSKRRVLVQADSHLYNDCGDCSQTLSGVTLVPLAPGNATFTLDQAETAERSGLTGRVASPVGALMIETPVRRLLGARFDFTEMKRVGEWARKRAIGLHLDGARLFLESVYTGRSIKDYAALFDTIYISMYKYFNAAAGAILAGPKALLADLYHTRRMFGGGLHQVWPDAAVALHYVEGFETRFRNGMETAERAISELAKDPSFEFERVANGTNVLRMRVHHVNAPIYNGRLDAAGISARTPSSEWFTLQVNETWGRVPAAEIVARFRKALG
jgi:threonine aldolase